MNSEMAAGFWQGAGFNPSGLKTLIFVIVFGIVFLIGAWLGTLILKAYGNGDLDASEAMRAAVSVVTLVVLILGVLSAFLL